VRLRLVLIARAVHSQWHGIGKVVNAGTCLKDNVLVVLQTVHALVLHTCMSFIQTSCAGGVMWSESVG
jgi:hypothetical protein